jgi:hypothetical protein
MKNIIFIVLALLSLVSHADCVYGAKSKMSFVVLDSHSILLKNGVGKDILIKSFAFFYSSSSVTVLKDSFCDYESAVLYVDGEAVDVTQVKWI